MIEYVDHFVVINQNFDILYIFYIFSSCNFITFIALLWLGTIYFLIGFIIYVSLLNYSAKNTKNLCVRSIQEFTILSAHTNTRSRHRFLGDPITKYSAITLDTRYAVGRSVGPTLIRNYFQTEAPSTCE